jgi:hypothetical protein
VQLAAQWVLHLYGEASTADVIGGLTPYVPPRQAMYGTNTALATIWWKRRAFSSGTFRSTACSCERMR